MPKVTRETAEAGRVLGKRGRFVVRYSGTENIARVMVEGERDGREFFIAAGMSSC